MYTSYDYEDNYYDEEMEYSNPKHPRYWGETKEERRQLNKREYEMMLITSIVKINPNLSAYDKMLLGLKR